MVEIFAKYPPTEFLIQKNEALFNGKTTASDMRGWIKGQIQKYSKKDNLEYTMVFQGILNAYNHFHPEVKLELEIDSWKGKSSFEIIDKIDNILVVKYQKPIKDGEPEKQETIFQKREMLLLLECIDYLKDYELIPTSILSMTYSDREELGHTGWKTGEKPVFCDRKFHNSFTIMLNVLDKLGMIEYKGGITQILNFKTPFQEALERFLSKQNGK
jgi:hypothetical protein